MAKSEIMGSREVSGNNQQKVGVRLFVSDTGESDIDTIGTAEFPKDTTGLYARKFVSYKIQPRWLGAYYLIVQHYVGERVATT